MASVHVCFFAAGAWKCFSFVFDAGFEWENVA